MTSDPIRERAQALLLEAMELEDEDRENFIRTSCADDDALESRLRELLARSSNAGDYFEGIAGRIGIGTVLPKGDDAVWRIGPYRVVKPIGRGGMGAVYLAEREDKQFEHQVAIKLLPKGLDEGEWRRRFLIEREILARLTHKNICRLFDGGVTEDGTPYFVMEYVDGQTIDEHCSSLDVDAILELFLDVCAAIGWAHRHLVVHRDIKPGNVLVSKTGEVKLVDFGIAKLLDPELHANATASGLSPMTPRYASPEMLEGAPITTSTDVFGLGVLLFELLTKKHPFDADGSATDARLKISRGEHPLASQAADQTTAGRLRGDLDQILAKAIRAEPRARYRSVAQFAEDIRNHLDHRPIVARPPTVGYRLRKLYRRRQGLVLSGALSFLMAIVLAGLAGSFTLATVRHSKELSLERNRANMLREKAERETAAATRVSDFLINLFKVNIPGKKDKRDLTARALLDEGAKKISQDLESEPAIRARLLATMSDAYTELGLFDEGVRLAEEALTLQRSLSEESPEVGSIYTKLARLWLKKGEYEKASEFANRGLVVLERSPGDQEERRIAAHIWAAYASWRLAQTSTATAHFEKALAMQERRPTDEECSIASTLNGLAILAMQRGDSKASIPYYEKAIAICEPRWGKTHRSLAHTLNNLALAYINLPDLPRAKKTLLRALAIREEILEKDHPDIAEGLNNLSDVLLRMEDYPAAYAAAKRSLEIREKTLDPNHDYIGTSLVNVGGALHGLGRSREARPMLERSLRMFEKKFGPKHEFLAYPLLGLARVKIAVGDPAGAERDFQRLLKIRRARIGGDHPETKAAQLEYDQFRAGNAGSAR